MQRETAYRVANALTRMQRGVWVPVPSDFWDSERLVNDWCVMNALHPTPIFDPTQAMWADVKGLEKLAARAREKEKRGREAQGGIPDNPNVH